MIRLTFPPEIMRFSRLTFCFLLCGSLGQAFAQKFSDKPGEFLNEVKTMMENSKSAEALKTAKNLESVWGSGVTETQQAKIVDLSKKMAVRKYKTIQHFKPFYDAVYQAYTTAQISPGEMNNFLNVLDVMVEKYNSTQTQRFLEVSHSFFEKRALFTSRFNRLYALNGTFTFEIKDLPKVAANDDWGKPEEKKPEVQTDNKKDPKKPAKLDAWGNPIPEKDNTKKEEVKYDKNGWPIDTQASQTNIAIDTIFTPASYTYTKPLQPAVSGPVLKLTNAVFVFASASDSVVLDNTSGSLMFKDGVFVGKGGRFNWSSVAMPQVFVDFDEYNFDIRSTRLHAEDVKLTYDSLLTQHPAGIFDFDAKPHRSVKDAVFPRFSSLDNDITFRSIGRNLIYKGGLTLIGLRLTSSSYLGKPSTLRYVADRETRFKLVSRQFDFADSLIVSPATSVTFYKKFADKEDSTIYHPSVRLKYNRNSAFLQLMRLKNGFRNATYMDFYHRVNISVDLVEWRLDSTRIDFRMVNARDSLPALFESQDFFNKKRYLDLKGLYKFHPLQVLFSYCKMKNLPTDKNPTVTIEEVAAAYKLDPATFRGAMGSLAEQGYVDYNPVASTVTIFAKATHNVLSYQKAKDFDNLFIPSYTVKKPNATYDLNTNFMTIRGVDGFNIRGRNSDDTSKIKKSAVSIRPGGKTREDKEIQLGANRSILMSVDVPGQIQIGDNRWVGKEFFFLYDNFTMEMPKIDSVIFVRRDSAGNKIAYGGEIRYQPGIVNIDESDNKSGLKATKGYPKFNAQGGGTIYFKDRLRRTYGDSVRLVFKGKVQENLDMEQPSIDGTFMSNGLFPDIPNIRLEYVQTKRKNAPPIPSFVHNPPPEGYEIYAKTYKGKAKAKFNGKLIMDTLGLHAAGQIEYMSAIIKSNKITFTPDSIVGSGTVAELREVNLGEAVYPKIGVKEFRMKWFARKDSMNLYNPKDKPFELYQKTTTLNGYLTVTGKGMFGGGNISRKDCEILDSPRYKFEKDKFTAQECQYFRVFAKDPTKYVLEANLANINFDIAKGAVNIRTALVGFSGSLKFPFAGYKTSINQANWNINQKIIAMNGDVKTTTFTSFLNGDEAQEDLRFNAGIGLYLIDKMTLNIGGIPYIKVADAKITPNRGAMVVEENAVIRELTKATMSLDTVNEYHKFNNASLRILSKDKFEGTADYMYINPDGQNFSIKFSDFQTVLGEATASNSRKRDKSLLSFTTAKGSVEQGANFHLSSGLLFYGDVTMNAPQKDLEMKGFIKLNLKSQPELGRWIAYQGGDKNLGLEVNERLEGEGYKLTAGLFLDKASSEVYHTFISEKRNADDEAIFQASGKLGYKPEGNRFSVMPSEKTAELTTSGNEITLKDSLGIFEWSGKMNFAKLPPEYLQAAGVGKLNVKSKDLNCNSFLVLNFPVSQQVVSNIGQAVGDFKAAEGNNIKEAAENRDELFSNLAEIIGDKQAKEYKIKADADYTPLLSSSKKLLTTLVISSVNLKWSEANSAFYSTGKVGVSNIGNNDINARFEGYVEIKKSLEGGDEVAVLLELTPDNWYFFNYRQSQLGIVSSNESVNGTVSSKGSKAKAGQYAVIAVSADEKVSFVERFKAAYTGTANKAKKPSDKKKDEKKDGF
jgi:hypothetical protein